MRGPTRLCARVTTRARDNNRTEVALFVAPNAFGAFSLFWDSFRGQVPNVTSSQKQMANWFPYVPPKTQAHENRCPLRATRPFSATGSVPSSSSSRSPRRPLVRARAPELAPRRVQATQSAAGTASDRLEVRSARFVARGDARRARSVPRRRRHFLRHACERQFPPSHCDPASRRVERVARNPTERGARRARADLRSGLPRTRRLRPRLSGRTGPAPPERAARTRRRVLSRSAFAATSRHRGGGDEARLETKWPADRRR